MENMLSTTGIAAPNSPVRCSIRQVRRLSRELCFVGSLKGTEETTDRHILKVELTSEQFRLPQRLRKLADQLLGFRFGSDDARVGAARSRKEMQMGIPGCYISI